MMIGGCGTGTGKGTGLVTITVRLLSRASNSGSSWKNTDIQASTRSAIIALELLLVLMRTMMIVKLETGLKQ